MVAHQLEGVMVACPSAVAALPASTSLKKEFQLSNFNFQELCLAREPPTGRLKS
jgi:hypothetical protein